MSRTFPKTGSSTYTAPDADELVRRVAQVAAVAGTSAPFINTDAPIELVRCQVSRFVSSLGRPGTCRACDRTIFWIRTTNGKNAPYTREALSHFADCPAAATFRRDKTPQ